MRVRWSLPLRIVALFCMVALLVASSRAWADLLAAHFVRTTESVKLGGKVYPPGSYLNIEYDGGDVWLTNRYRYPGGGGYTPETEIIEKYAATLVQSFEYKPWPIGTIKRQTPLYAHVPGVQMNPTTLLQIQRGNRTLNVGDKVTIFTRTENVYTVGIAARNSPGMEAFGSVAVSDVEIDPGRPTKEFEVKVPPAPPIKTHEMKEAEFEERINQKMEAGAETPFDRFVALLFRYAPWSFAALLTGPFLALGLVLTGLKHGIFGRFFRKSLFALRRVTGQLAQDEKDYLKDRREYKALLPRINARFPEYDIYRVPEKLRGVLGLSPSNPHLTLDEHAVGVWNHLLATYPAPPRSEAEREQREADFWNLYAGFFTTTDAKGKPSLKPKQEILDYFSALEKWIFREFYAATGVVHKTIVEEIVRHYVEQRRAYISEDTHKIEKANDARERFDRETLPAHYEKEGEWFHFHIQEAFDRLHGTHDDFGAQTTKTPVDDDVNDDLRWRPNV
jgi:hypothetical protein